MSRAILAALSVLLSAGVARAQDPDPVQVKKRILDKVRERLAAERAATLKRVEKIIDEELAKTPAGPPAKLPADADKRIKDLEKRLRVLDDERETLQAEIARARREAAEEPIRQAAQKEIPNEPETVQKLFDDGIKLHEAKKFDDSTLLFKKIYYRFPKTRIANISAYNVACGFALAGKKDEALDWLETSVREGYNDYDHMRADADLDSLRNERRYKKLLTDK